MMHETPLTSMSREYGTSFLRPEVPDVYNSNTSAVCLLAPATMPLPAGRERVAGGKAEECVWSSVSEKSTTSREAGSSEIWKSPVVSVLGCTVWIGRRRAVAAARIAEAESAA